MGKDEARTLITRAQNNAYSAGKLKDDKKCHDDCGYILNQATEKFLKGICEIRGIEYPKFSGSGHDLEGLFQLLEKDGFSDISSHEDLLDLSLYSSSSRYDFTPVDDRLNLDEYYAKVKALEALAVSTFNKKT